MASYRGGSTDIEELTQKIDAKQLKEEAKKRDTKTLCQEGRHRGIAKS